MNGYDMNLFTQIVDCLKSCGTKKIWACEDEIICETEQQADTIADLLEALGYDYVNTGYYDPEEDAKEGRTYETTGYWYVSID